jgi:uncharacterized protein DUF2846
MRRSRLWIFALGSLVLAACAGGPPPGPEPALAPDKARLYVYRDFMPGDSPDWTTVSLDHHPLGASAPGTVFYRDVTPGTYEVEVRSDKLYPDQFKTVRVAAGSRTYVKIEQAPFWGNSPWGWQGTTFVVAIVNPALGAQEVAHLRPSAG